jgi:hypothetical protein
VLTVQRASNFQFQFANLGVAGPLGAARPAAVPLLLEQLIISLTPPLFARIAPLWKKPSLTCQFG